MDSLKRSIGELTEDVGRLRQDLSENEANLNLQLEIELEQAEIDRQKSLLNELARRRLMLRSDLHHEPRVNIVSKARIHAPGDDWPADP
jgi:hypothetical protein